MWYGKYFSPFSSSRAILVLITEKTYTIFPRESLNYAMRQQKNMLTSRENILVIIAMWIMVRLQSSITSRVCTLIMEKNDWNVRYSQLDELKFDILLMMWEREYLWEVLYLYSFWLTLECLPGALNGHSTELQAVWYRPLARGRLLGKVERGRDIWFIFYRCLLCGRTQTRL